MFMLCSCYFQLILFSSQPLYDWGEGTGLGRRTRLGLLQGATPRHKTFFDVFCFIFWRLNAAWSYSLWQLWFFGVILEDKVLLYTLWDSCLLVLPLYSRCLNLANWWTDRRTTSREAFTSCPRTRLRKSQVRCWARRLLAPFFVFLFLCICSNSSKRSETVAESEASQADYQADWWRGKAKQHVGPQADRMWCRGLVEKKFVYWSIEDPGEITGREHYYVYNYWIFKKMLYTQIQKKRK